MARTARGIVPICELLGKSPTRPGVPPPELIQKLYQSRQARAFRGEVRRQPVYWWIKEWKVERLVDALKLSRASGIPIEKLAGEVVRQSGRRGQSSGASSDKATIKS